MLECVSNTMQSRTSPSTQTIRKTFAENSMFHRFTSYSCNKEHTSTVLIHKSAIGMIRRSGRTGLVLREWCGPNDVYGQCSISIAYNSRQPLTLSIAFILNTHPVHALIYIEGHQTRDVTRYQMQGQMPSCRSKRASSNRLQLSRLSCPTRAIDICVSLPGLHVDRSSDSQIPFFSDHCLHPQTQL